MTILGIDSSASAGSAAIIEGGKLIGESFINIGLTHSQTLMPLIENTLKNTNKTLDDIDLIALSTGPGSFTGIRIGLATAKGLAAPNRIPCYGVSTLACIAQPLINSGAIIISCMDARNNQVYYSIFRSDYKNVFRLTEDKADSLENLSEGLKEFNETKIIIGDGANIAYDFFQEKHKDIYLANEEFKHQRAASAAFIADNEISKMDKSPLDAALLQPVYLRLPQAERELKKRKLKD